MRSDYIIPSSDITEADCYDPLYHSDINFDSKVTIATGKYKSKKGVAIGVTPKKIRVWLGPFDRNDKSAGPVNFFREQLVIDRHERAVPPTPPKSKNDDPYITPRTRTQRVPNVPDEVKSEADDYSFVNANDRYEDALMMTDMKIALICIERCMYTHDIPLDDTLFVEYIHAKLQGESPHDPSLKKERKKKG